MAKIYGFVGKFGKQGNTDGLFSTFRGITSDSTRLYVADPTRIQIFGIDSPWSHVHSIPITGNTASGQIVVDDTHIYSIAARELRVTRYNKTTYASESVFLYMSGTDSTAIADDGNNIIIFHLNGTSGTWYELNKASFSSIVSRGSFSYASYGHPTQAVIVNSVMYIANNSVLGMVKFPNYPLLTSPSFIGATSLHWGIVLDTNCIYGTNLNTIRSYDISSLAYRDYFGATGYADGYFNSPNYMTYQNGKLYICDATNYRIQIINWSDIAGLNAPTALSLACVVGGKIQVSWTDNS